MLNNGMVDRENLWTNKVSYSRFRKCATIMPIDKYCDVESGGAVEYINFRRRKGIARWIKIGPRYSMMKTVVQDN